MSLRGKVLAFLAAAAFGIAVYAVLIATPDRPAITVACEPEGGLNRLRAQLQGNRYWSAQLEALDAEVEYLERFPAIMARADSVAAWARSQGDSALGAIYVKHPELRTRLAPSDADVLREVANELDRARTRQLIDSLNAERLINLILCRDSLVARS